MTKNELIEKLAEEIPPLHAMKRSEVEVLVDAVMDFLVTKTNTSFNDDQMDNPDHDAGCLTDDQIDLIGDNIPNLVIPKETRRVKINRIIRKPDPHLFHPPDEDDILCDIDE